MGSLDQTHYQNHSDNRVLNQLRVAFGETSFLEHWKARAERLIKDTWALLCFLHLEEAVTFPTLSMIQELGKLLFVNIPLNGNMSIAA